MMKERQRSKQEEQRKTTNEQGQHIRDTTNDNAKHKELMITM